MAASRFRLSWTAPSWPTPLISTANQRWRHANRGGGHVRPGTTTTHRGWAQRQTPTFQGESLGRYAHGDTLGWHKPRESTTKRPGWYYGLPGNRVGCASRTVSQRRREVVS